MSADFIARGLAASQGKSANAAALVNAVRNYGFYPQPAARAPAADVPTVAVSAGGAVSAINGRAAGNPLVMASDNRIKWLSGPTVVDASGAWLPRGAWYAGGRSTQYAAVEFVHTGTSFEFCCLGYFVSAQNNLRMLVNDRTVSVQSLPSGTGAYHYVRFTFPSAATRRIRIEGANGKFRGVNVAASGEIAASGRNQPLVSIMGDSFVEGTGAAMYQDGEAVALVRAIGGNVVLGGVGATGLLNPGTGGKVIWTDPNRITDLTMAGVTDALGYPTTPALGIVMMSLNDQGLGASTWSAFGATYQAAIGNRIWTLIDAWNAANPGRPLVIFGPTWTNETPTLDIHRMRDAAQEACWGAAGQNVWFIDRLGPGTLTRKGVRTSLGAAGTTAAGSAVVTALTTTAGVGQGSGLVGATIPAGARVMTIDSATQVTLDLPATAAATASSLTFINDHAALMTNLPGDTTHPNAAGHTLDALWCARELRRLILTEFA